MLEDLEYVLENYENAIMFLLKGDPIIGGVYREIYKLKQKGWRIRLECIRAEGLYLELVCRSNDEGEDKIRGLELAPIRKILVGPDNRNIMRYDDVEFPADVKYSYDPIKREYEFHIPHEKERQAKAVIEIKFDRLEVWRNTKF